MFWIALIVLIALVLVWLMIVRPMLKNQPVFSRAFAAEASFVDKVRAKITGWRTRIAAQLTIISGLVVGLYDQILPFVSGQDWTPLTAKIPAWALPVGMVGVGLLFAWLRKITDTAPVVITQKDETGEAKVVAVVTPPTA